MGDCYETSGSPGMGLDIDSASRQEYRIESGQLMAVCIVPVSVSGRASPSSPAITSGDKRLSDYWSIF